MRYQFPIKETIQYTTKEAVSELKQVEIDAMRRVKACLEGNAYDEIVNLLLDIDAEIELIVNESRRLRLQGKLDVNIFNIMVKGYSDIKERVFDLLNRYGLLKEIRSLYTFNKYAAKASKRI
jgi:hypothetical protein